MKKGGAGFKLDRTMAASFQNCHAKKTHLDLEHTLTPHD
jgi:hypothetical protein